MKAWKSNLNHRSSPFLLQEKTKKKENYNASQNLILTQIHSLLRDRNQREMEEENGRRDERFYKQKQENAIL